MLKLLLVDDSEDGRWLALALLKKTALQIDIACDGQEALDKISQETYDLVLMDMQMPGMDGFEAVRELRRREGAGQFPGRARIPIAAVTAYDRPEEREKILTAGCDDHLVKPLRRAELFELLKRRIPGAEPLLTGAVEGLVPRYLKARVEEIPLLERASLEQDLAALAALAHRMRGLSGFAELGELEALGARLEGAARQGNAAEALELVPKILECLRRLEREARS